MKRFFTRMSGLLIFGGVMTFLLTAEAAIQNNFYNEVAQGNMMEIAAANAALQRSQNEQVRQFAQQMVTDHTAMGTELQTLAASKNVTVPAALDSKHQSDLDKLNARTGADFDRDFMRMMVRDHDRMAKMLQRESERNSDADVKAFAAKNVTVVQGHLATARALNETVRSNAGGASNSNRGNSSNRSDNTGGNTSNDNTANSGYSNRRPNVNRNANGNSNSDSTNRDTNTNRNTNRNTNTNGNSNNSNIELR